MLPPIEKKVIKFPTDADPASACACKSCGVPRQTASFCRICALRLIDVALCSSFGELTVHDESMDDVCAPAFEAVQLRYDHYEICLSADGTPWELGRGAMGITYKATDTHLNCPVALKIINARRLGGAKARDRFLREARTAACLRHPNIASVFHLGLGEADCFYAMEHIEGETLEAHVHRKGELSWRFALDIIAQCARALRTAHAQNFIHRDIKPTNIMLMGGEHHVGNDVVVKLIDFGLAKAVAENVSHDELSDAYFAGTPHYASPEQIAARQVDVRSDIYSLGRCLEYMLAAALPDRIDVQETGEPSEPSRLTGSLVSIPQTVIALWQKMTNADPNCRPQTADELLTEIGGCLSNAAVAAKLAGPSDGTIGFAGHHRKDRRLWLLAGTVFALAAATAFIGLGHLHRPSKESVESKAVQIPTVSVEARALFDQAGECFRKYTKTDTEKAINLYSKAVERSPEFTDAYALLASAYFENVGRYNAPASQLELGIASAQRAIAVDPKCSKAYQALGAIRSYQGENWEALTQLHHALEIDPHFLPAMCDFSLLWICVGEPQFALPWAEAAAKAEPAKIQGWHAAAEASVELCDDKRAEQYYTRCTELRPTWLPGYCGLIRLHLLQGDYARARQDFTKAQSIQPDLIFTLTLSAQIELFSGNYREAENIYRRLLAMDRNGMVGYYSGISYLSALGFLRLQAGDLREGQALLEEAAKAKSTSAEGSADVYNLAAIRAVQNRQEEALALLNQAVLSGWNDYRATQLDPRFSRLRERPEFIQMISQLSARVADKRRQAEALCQQPLDLAMFPAKRPDEKNSGRVNTPAKRD